MPKLAPRCNNRRGQAQLVYGNGPLVVPPVAFSAPPRKVSFEDGHRDAASSSSDDESSLPQQLCSDRASSSSSFTVLAIPALQEEAFSRPLSGLRRKSTLIRPTTSQCLVALASLEEEEEGDAHIESNTSNKRCRMELIRTDAPSPTQVFSELSVPVSPGPQDMNGSLPSACSGVSSPPNSPWGHFVDIVVASEEQQQQGRSHSVGALLSSSNKSHPTHHDARCNCCTSCRRRHAGPYGGVYNKNASSSLSSPERRPLCFLQNDNDIRPLFPITMNSKESRTTFKLQPSPRKDYEQPTEQLITALHHMRVD